MATPSIQYFSLRPADTWTLSKSSKANCPPKVALTIAAVVTVPLEIIARAFYNIGLWMVSLATGRSLRPANEFRFQGSAQLIASIDAANKVVPVLEGSLDRTSAIALGKAVGDGLGMFTEFLTRVEAQAQITNIEFSDRPRFSRPHVNRFPENGWTDDTDQAIMITRAEAAYNANPSKSKEARMAEQILNWRYNGLNGFSGVRNLAFTSRQDPGSADPNRRTILCQGLGALTSQVLEHPSFSSYPHEAALEVWKQGNKPIEERAAANGAVMRTAFIGSMYRGNLKLAVAEAIRYAKVTHADPRCIASAVAVTVAIALLSNGANAITATHHAEEIAVKVLWDEMEKVAPHLNASEQGHWKKIAQNFEKSLRFHMHADLPALNLEDKKAMGHTFKCLGAGFYVLRELSVGPTLRDRSKQAVFRDVMQRIIFEGGDADTNGAVAGALAGAYLGTNGIPDSWKRDLHPQDKAVMEETVRTVESIAKKFVG